MGGPDRRRSTVGLGSVFWFELNATEEPQLLDTRPAAIAVAKAPQNGPLRTLLYVEDNPRI